jgi:hypothetical protein
VKGKIKYTFVASVWQYAGKGGWYFVTLPKDQSAEIREHLGWQEESWGRLKVTARINHLTWDTAIWFDTKQQSYLLPLKSDIRQKLGLSIGTEVEVVVGV